MSRRNPMTLAAAIGTVLVVAALAAAQDGGFTFFESLDVEVVNVEVVVTGPDGVPVRGLTREDFELTEDGRPVPISNFYSVDAAPAEPLDPFAGPEAARAVEPADQQLHLAIFVDGMSLEPVGRRRALDALREFFDYQLAQPASLVLASFDGSLEVTYLPRFRPDDLIDNLDKLERASVRGTLREMERRNLLRDLDLAELGSGGRGFAGNLGEDVGPSEAQRLLSAVQVFAQQDYDRAVVSTSALASVVEALAGLPGRKALLYVSGGLARNPGEGLYHAWENKFAGFARQLGVNVNQLAREQDTTPILMDLIRHANANRVTFYTLGAGRSDLPGGATAEEGSLDVRAANTAGGGRSWSVGLAAVDNSNLGGTLQQLAAATGGLSMTNSRNYGSLLGAMNGDFAGYYSLGYTPDRQPDGTSHKLKVRVKDRELRVRHRETYRELTRQEIMRGRTRSAAMLGSRDNPLAVAVEFGDVERHGNKEFMVPVMVKVPLNKLVLIPQEEMHVGQIGIFICARDGKGRTSPVRSVEVPIRIPNDKLAAALEQVAGYRMVLQMRPEQHAVAVGVRDELGRIESTVTDLWDPTTPTS